MTDSVSEIDARLAAALEQSNYRITLANQKQNLRLKLKANLIHSVGGGIFNITTDLICFVSLMKEEDEIVLIDNNDNPILIENPKQFLADIISKYTEFTNSHYMAVKELNKKRNPTAIIGL